MKNIALLFSIISFSITSFSQNYSTAIGFRGGFSNGITVRHFISESNAIEGILSTRWRGFNITGLYEINNDLSVGGLNWYYGGGAHIGFFRGYENHPFLENNNSYAIIGIDGILGIEYTFSEIPLNLSLDWNPAFNVVGYTGFWADMFAISARYIIK